MPVISVLPGYRGEVRDREENFHGLRLFYLGWDQHLMFANPFALMLPRDLPFGAFVEGPLRDAYGEHPDFARIDWGKATWLRDGVPFAFDRAKSLDENGIGHKSVLRLRTPELRGIGGSCS